MKISGTLFPSRIARWLISGACLALVGWIVLAALVRPVGAHAAGKMQLSSAPAGPYNLTVWTSPDPVREGELHVASAVVLANDASPVLDAVVEVTLAPVQGSGPELSAPATTAQSANKFLYEANLEVARAGAYLVTVAVTGAGGESGATSFELEVLSGSAFDPLFLIPIGFGVAAVLLLWLARRQGRSLQLAEDTADATTD